MAFTGLTCTMRATAPNLSSGFSYTHVRWPTNQLPTAMASADTPVSWLSLAVSAAAFVLSFFSLRFSRLSWGEAHRPLIAVRLSTHAGGNEGFGLNLVIENTGNRPATDVALTVVDEAALDAAFSPAAPLDFRNDIKACFSSVHLIPVLANGRGTSNEFGFVSTGSLNRTGWKLGARIPVFVSYSDLDGKRKYAHRVTLYVADDRGFAGTYWDTPRATPARR